MGITDEFTKHAGKLEGESPPKRVFSRAIFGELLALQGHTQSTKHGNGVRQTVPMKIGLKTSVHDISYKSCSHVLPVLTAVS